MLRATLILSIASLLVLSSCSGSSNPLGPPSAADSTIEALAPFGAPANDSFTVSLRITVRDEQGRALSGKTVNVSVEGEGATVGQPGSTTNGMGETTATIRSSSPGPKVVTATVDPAEMMPTVLNQTATVTFVVPTEGALFVGPGGDDAADGTNATEPYASIAFALTQAVAGDTIYVQPGTYMENPIISVSGTENQPISLVADSDGAIFGTAAPVIIDAGGGEFGFQLVDVENFTLRGFTIVNTAATTTNAGAIWVTGTNNENFALIENEIYDNTRGIRITNGDRFQIEGNRISNNLGGLGDAISVEDSTRGIVARNLIYGNGGQGIVIETDVSLQLVSYNTVYQNQGAQYRQRPSTSVQLSDNIFANGGTDGIVIDSGGLIAETNNVTFGHAGNDFFSGAGNMLAGTSQVADPLLTNPAGADGLLGGAEAADDQFTTDVGSPALDMGSASESAQARFAFAGPLSGTTTRPDGVADGSAPDGAVGNIGFHSRITSTDGLSPLGVNDLRAAYALPGDTAVRHIRKVSGSTAWDSATMTSPTNREIAWVLHRVARTAPLEATLVLCDNGSSTDLFGRVWDGNRWSEDSFGNPLSSLIPTTASDQRPFDLAFEGQSGELMLVRSDETDIPVYRTWSGGRWSADQPVYATGPNGAGKVRWVQLVADANSDRICLVAVDDLGFITTSLWDGANWDADHTLIDATVAALNTKPFDVVFESQSGDLMLAYGHTTNVEEIRYRTRAAESATWVPAEINSMEAFGAVVRMAASPTTDQIALVVGEGTLDDDVAVAIWDGGTNWADIAEIDSTGAASQTDFGIGWNQSGARALVIYRDDDAADTVDFARFRPGGWNVIADQTVPGLNDPVAFQIVPDQVDTARLRILVEDASNSLWELSSDGETVQVENGGAAVVTGLPTASPNAPFSLGIRY